MKVKFLLKYDNNYDAMSHDQFLSQIVPSNNLSIALQKSFSSNIIDVWNEFFDIDYLKYRSLMKENTLKSLDRTNCEIIKGKEALLKSLEDREEFVLIPVDDDDLFSIQTSQLGMLFEKNPNLSVLNWKRTVLQCTSTFSLIISEGHSACPANFAIRSSVAHKLIDSIYEGHKELNRLISFKPRLFSRIHTEDFYSLHLRHVGCLSYINKKIDRNQLKDSFKRASESGINSIDLPEQLKWAEEFIETTVDINIKIRNFIRLI